MPQGFKLLDAEVHWPPTGRHLWSVVQVESGHQTGWQLRIRLERHEQSATAIFSKVVGFRVHDEA